MSNPLVSVVVPSYNRAGYLRECLLSLQAQTEQDCEFIVVDDHSSDDSTDVVREFASHDPRFQLLVQPTSSGAPRARNRGLEHSKGKYICFLDCDDLFHRRKLESQVAVLQAESSLDAVVCQTLIFTDNPMAATRLSNCFDDRPPLERFLSLDYVWQTSAPLWRTDFVRMLGGYKPDLTSQQDVEFHIRALIKGAKIDLSDEPLNLYRIHTGPRVSGGKPERSINNILGFLADAREALESSNLWTERYRQILRDDMIWLSLEAAKISNRELLNSVFKRALHLAASPLEKARIICCYPALSYVRARNRNQALAKGNVKARQIIRALGFDLSPMSHFERVFPGAPAPE